VRVTTLLPPRQASALKQRGKHRASPACWEEVSVAFYSEQGVWTVRLIPQRRDGGFSAAASFAPLREAGLRRANPTKNTVPSAKLSRTGCIRG